MAAGSIPAGRTPSRKVIKLGLIGFDIETTGLDPDRHGIISMGLYEYTSLQYWTMNPGDVEYDPKALEVNGWTEEQARQNPNYSDEAIALNVYNQFLASPDEMVDAYSHIPEEKKGKLHAVGFNVGSFDLVFLKKYYPKTAGLFHYRSLDINSLVLFLSDWTFGTSIDWKKEIKEAAIADIEDYSLVAPEDRREHHPVYDAALAYHAKSVLKEMLLKKIFEQATANLTYMPEEFWY